MHGRERKATRSFAGGELGEIRERKIIKYVALLAWVLIKYRLSFNIALARKLYNWRAVDRYIYIYNNNEIINKASLYKSTRDIYWFFFVFVKGRDKCNDSFCTCDILFFLLPLFSFLLSIYVISLQGLDCEPRGKLISRCTVRVH